MSIDKLILLFVAGGLGTLARFGINALAVRTLAREFPWGTTVINAFGCLMFGVVIGLLDARVVPKEWGPVILVGFLGAYTTFSTFAYEAEALLSSQRWFAFAAYLALQNTLGIVCVTLGLRMVR